MVCAYAAVILAGAILFFGGLKALLGVAAVGRLLFASTPLLHRQSKADVKS
jgi:hypothetical protein